MGSKFVLKLKTGMRSNTLLALNVARTHLMGCCYSVPMHTGSLMLKKTNGKQKSILVHAKAASLLVPVN